MKMARHSASRFLSAIVLLQATKVIERPTRPTPGEQRRGCGTACNRDEDSASGRRETALSAARDVRELAGGNDDERGRHLLAALLLVAGLHVCARLERCLFDRQRRWDR